MINKSDLPKFNPDIYVKITLNDLVVFSIYYLHAKNDEVLPEDIISACFMLFPKRFSLKHHPHWPDSAMVNRHWGVCRSKGYIAANDPGFKLTAKGGRLAKKVAKALGMEISKRAGTPSGKVQSVERKEKTIKPAAVKKGQYPRSKARVVMSAPKVGTAQNKKTILSVPAEKIRPSRSKIPTVGQVKETQPVQKEKEFLPTSIKKAHPVRSKKVSPAKKEKIIVMEQKEKAVLQPAVGAVQSTRSKARSVMQKQKAQPVATSPVSVRKAHPVRVKKVSDNKKEKIVVIEQKEKSVLQTTPSKMRAVTQKPKAQPVATPPAPIKKAHPARSKKVPAAKKEKKVVIEQKEKAVLQPAVGTVQSALSKARTVTREQKLHPIATPLASIKKATPVRSQKVIADKNEKTAVIEQKAKVVPQPVARKTRSPRSKLHPATQAKTTQLAQGKIAPPKPVVQPIKPATLIKNVRPIWTEKTKPPEPVVRPVIVEKVQPIQSEKTTHPAQSSVTQELKIRAGKFVQAMETSDAYIHYKKNGKSSKIGEFDFRSLLLCTMESSPETLARNMEQFKSYASIHNRRDLVAFLNFCEDKLSYLLTTQANRPAKSTRKQ